MFISLFCSSFCLFPALQFSRQYIIFSSVKCVIYWDGKADVYCDSWAKDVTDRRSIRVFVLQLRVEERE